MTRESESGSVFRTRKVANLHVLGVLIPLLHSPGQRSAGVLQRYLTPGTNHAAL